MSYRDASSSIKLVNIAFIVYVSCCFLLPVQCRALVLKTIVDVQFENNVQCQRRWFITRRISRQHEPFLSYTHWSAASVARKFASSTSLSSCSIIVTLWLFSVVVLKTDANGAISHKTAIRSASSCNAHKQARMCRL
jgi:hypothetical protein